jgi:predicted nucleotidyltransferase component of viral defense system
MRIDIEKLREFYPPALRTQEHTRHILKELIQYQILDFLSASRYARSLCFIGGTNLRLIHGIDRFSEDLDFDIKSFPKEDFLKMTDSILSYLKNLGYHVKIDDKQKDEKLSAFRRNITFPLLLYDNGLSPFKEEKFLIKIESEDQGYNYQSQIKNIKGVWGYIFNFSVPPDDVLCSMKLAALINRQKGRDFYDVMFLLSKTEPDYDMLEHRTGIKSLTQLKEKLINICDTTNLKYKSRDFEHLLFNKDNAKKILLFRDFIDTHLTDEE